MKVKMRFKLNYGLSLEALLDYKLNVTDEVTHHRLGIGVVGHDAYVVVCDINHTVGSPDFNKVLNYIRLKEYIKLI